MDMFRTLATRVAPVTVSCVACATTEAVTVQLKPCEFCGVPMMLPLCVACADPDTWLECVACYERNYASSAACMPQGE